MTRDQPSDHSVRRSTDTNGEANPTLHREGGPRSASAVCVLSRAQKLTDHRPSETYDDTTRLSVIILNDVLAVVSLLFLAISFLLALPLLLFPSSS